jgi:hypothetical protein
MVQFGSLPSCGGLGGGRTGLSAVNVRAESGSAGSFICGGIGGGRTGVAVGGVVFKDDEPNNLPEFLRDARIRHALFSLDLICSKLSAGRGSGTPVGDSIIASDLHRTLPYCRL